MRMRPNSLAAGTRNHLTFSARAHFLKSGGKLYEIPPQSRYSRFAKIRDSNGLHFVSHLRSRRV